MKYSYIVVFLFLFSGTVSAQTAEKNLVNDTTYMLTYDHGGLILWGSDHFRERLKNAVEWLDKYPSFKIGLDNEAQIYDYFATDEPQLITELNNLLDKYRDRFGIGSCTYGQPLSQFINDESNIRQISYALAAERKYFNSRPTVYMMSEHAMHSQIPQIIKGFGFEGAIMRTHFMMYGYNPTFNVPVGWWVGMDGSKIKTIPTYTGERAEFAKTTVDNWILTRYPGEDSKISPEGYRSSFKNINPLLASRADDSGLRKEDLVKEYENKPKFRWILLEELLGKYPEPVTDMPTKPNDFVVRMPWGYYGNEIWNNSRKAEISVLTAERLAAMEVLNGGVSHEEDLDISWKNLLLAQHHDIQIVGLLPDARKLLPLSISKSEESVKESMNFFASSMKGEGLSQITVFNPLSWEQSVWICGNVALHKGEAKAFVADIANTNIPVRILESDNFSDGSILDARIAFRADLPPLSLNAFSILPVRSNDFVEESILRYDESRLFIVTPYYEVKLSKEGGLTYLKDIKTGRYIAGGQGRSAFFEGKINGMDLQSSGKWVIQKSGEQTPWIKITEHGFIADIPFEFEMTFYEDNPRIDCKVRFEFNGQKIGLLSNDLRDGHSPFVHEEKLRFKFFPAIDTAATGIRDLPFAISETANKYVEGNYWTALSDGKTGVAFFNKGNMSSVREKDNSFSIPLAYAMYYVWGTRMLYGPFSYEFAILPFNGNWRNADLHRKALEYSFPIPVSESKPGTGVMEDRINNFSFSGDPDIIMTALYPSKENIVARFFKSDNHNQVSSIHFMKKIKDMTEITLDGKYIRNSDGNINFTPWEIKTFRINTK